MTQVPVTSLVAALVTAALLALSLHVSRLRLRYRVGLGDGGHKDLQVAVRTHGNALEQSLLFLLLLLIAESQAHAFVVLVGTSAVFLAARLAHAAGLLSGNLLLRQIGHAVTLITQLVLVVALLLEAF